MNKLMMQFSILIGLFVFTSSVFGETRKVWNGMPLSMSIPVGEEIRVRFPTEVDVQVPMGVTTKLKSLAPDTTMVYWTATEAFDTARIFVMSLDGKSVYILDVSAADTGLHDDVVIEDPARLPQESQVVTEADETLRDPASIILARYVSQTLYAPKRLVPSSNNIQLIDTPKLPSDFPLVRSSSGERYRVEVVGQWAGFDQYITAVVLRNISPLNVNIPVVLSNVRGHFSHASAQHLSLGAKGTLDDRTTLYLISAVPFQDAIMGEGYAY